MSWILLCDECVCVGFFVLIFVWFYCCAVAVTVVDVFVTNIPFVFKLFGSWFFLDLLEKLFRFNFLMSVIFSKHWKSKFAKKFILRKIQLSLALFVLSPINVSLPSKITIFPFRFILQFLRWWRRLWIKYWYFGIAHGRSGSLWHKRIVVLYSTSAAANTTGALAWRWILNQWKKKMNDLPMMVGWSNQCKCDWNLFASIDFIWCGIHWKCLHTLQLDSACYFLVDFVREISS